MPARPAPVDDLGAAIVAVAAQQDLRSGPMVADRAHQAAQEGPNFLAFWALGGAQHGGDEVAFAIEHDDGLEAVFVMMSVEQAQLLTAMHSVKRVIDVEHDALEHGGETVAVQIDHRPAHAQQGAYVRQVFQPRDRRLRTQGAIARGQIERHLEHGIDPQAGCVIAVLITRRNHHQPKANDIGKAMRDMFRRARIPDAGRQPFGHLKTPLSLTQQ